MRMVEANVTPTFVAGLWRTRAKTVFDDRGGLTEFYRVSRALEHRLNSQDRGWTQVNAVVTKRGGLRGIHAEKMTKLVMVVTGMIKSVHPDLRPLSATRGQTFSTILHPGQGMLIPAGVGNGFQAMADTVYVYMFSQEWAPDMPRVDVNPLDPALEITWPTRPMMVSDKDKAAPGLAEALERGEAVFT